MYELETSREVELPSQPAVEGKRVKTLLSHNGTLVANVAENPATRPEAERLQTVISLVNAGTGERLHEVSVNGECLNTFFSPDDRFVRWYQSKMTCEVDVVTGRRSERVENVLSKFVEDSISRREFIAVFPLGHAYVVADFLKGVLVVDWQGKVVRQFALPEQHILDVSPDMRLLLTDESRPGGAVRVWALPGGDY
jgi:hypothetical protein